MRSVSSEEMMDDSRNVTGIPTPRPTSQDIWPDKHYKIINYKSLFVHCIVWPSYYDPTVFHWTCLITISWHVQRFCTAIAIAFSVVVGMKLQYSYQSVSTCMQKWYWGAIPWLRPYAMLMESRGKHVDEMNQNTSSSQRLFTEMLGH